MTTPARFAFTVAVLSAAVLSAAAQTGQRTVGAEVFDESPPRQFEVQLSSEAMASLRAQPREDASGTVRVGGITYSNVAIHLKGVATSAAKRVGGSLSATSVTRVFAS